MKTIWLFIAFSLASCSSFNNKDESKRSISSEKSNCYRVGNFTHNAEICHDDEYYVEYINSNGDSNIRARKAIAAKKMRVTAIYTSEHGHYDDDFFLLTPGVCSYNKKFCVGQQLKDGWEVAGVYFTTEANSKDILNDTVIIRDPATNKYRRHRSDMDKIYAFYKGNVQRICKKDIIYEGNVVGLSDSKNANYRATILNDNSGKCSAKLSVNSYGAIHPFVHIANVAGFKRFESQDSNSFKPSRSTFYEIFSEKPVPNNGMYLTPIYNEDGVMQEFSVKFNYYVISSIYRMAAPSLVQSTQFSCENLVAHVQAETCSNKYIDGAYPGYEHPSSFDKQSDTGWDKDSGWVYRFRWSELLIQYDN